MAPRSGWARPERVGRTRARQIRSLEGVEILLWLVPPLVVTVLAMLWIGWLGRERTEEVDREAAVARMAKALESGRAVSRDSRPQPARDRSRGIAVRPSRVHGAPEVDQRRAG